MPIIGEKKAIVTRLASIEELAGIDILCSDKTGTLTKNTFTLGETFTAPKISEEEVLFSAVLSSRAEDNDPIDTAILQAQKTQKRRRSLILFRLIRYKSERKASVQEGKKIFTVTKEHHKSFFNSAIFRKHSENRRKKR